MIVKIQNRRGGYTDYDPSKLLPGEFAVVQVGDPNTPTGKGVYLAITAGDVVRLATTEEIAAYTQQFDDIYQSTLQDAGVILDEAKLLISNYTGNLIVVDSISDMTDTSSLYLYNGSGEYKNYVYVYDPSQSGFVPLVNYGMFADLSEQISQNASNIAANTSNIATNTANIATNAANIATNAANIATNTANIATNASNITENAVNIAGLATGVTNKIVKTTLSTTQIYANETASAYNSLSISGLSDYMIVLVNAYCANLRQTLIFVNGDTDQQYLYEINGNNKIRGGFYVDWENERVRVRCLSPEGLYTYQNVYFTKVAGFIKQGAIDGSGSSEFTPYQALYDAIIAYIDEHYTPSSSDSVPNEVKQAIYTLSSKAAYTETGLTDEIATVEAWTATTFNITNRLTNCASSNSVTVVNSRTRYITTLTANTGYVLNTVTVTMGGVDITSTAYSSGTITIPSVTGNIVITATAVAAVASLSAVYTQSGTVYDIADLDDLKSDLVVTATYSDSSTATIPSTDYTLSGTLTEGTSVITVTYGGKTATFNVAVTAKVPAGYTAYDYAVAVANNSANSVIDTGIIFNPVGYAYDIKFKWRAITGANTVSNPLMGCRNTNSTTTTDAFAFYCKNDSMGYHLLGNDGGVTLSTSIGTINTVHWNFVDGSDSTLTFNGTTHTIGTLSLSQITASTKSFCLLGTNKAGTKVNSTNAIYSQLGEVVFYDQNGDIAYHFVPAKNTNDEYGFYERVGGNFYGKSSSYVTCGNWD